MGINIKTPGARHIALRSTDMDRAKRFYIETLGFPLVTESDELFLFSAGKTAIGVRAPGDDTPDGDEFNPFRVGLDHQDFKRKPLHSCMGMNFEAASAAILQLASRFLVN